MPRHRPALPFDVLEAIVDALAADDTPMLTNVKTFSLACKALLHCCRKHVFKTIVVGFSPAPSLMDNIDDDDPGNNLSSYDAMSREILPSCLCRLISMQPQLSDYVRVLKLGISRDAWRHWEESDFAQVLQRFSRLQSLTLDMEYDSEYETMVEWIDIPHPIRNSFLFLIRLETLTSLTLRSLFFPFFQVEVGINLRCLHIDDVAFFEEENGVVKLSHYVQPILLHQFSMGCLDADTMDNILNARLPDNRRIFDFSELHHLRAAFYIAPEDVDKVREIINKTILLRTLSLTSEVDLLKPTIHRRINIFLPSP